LSARPEAPTRDLLDGLTALLQRSLGAGQVIVLLLDDDGSLQHVCPADAAPDLVARALARSGSSLRSVGGDPPITSTGVASDFGPALCVPVSCQDHMVGVLYAETGRGGAAFPPELVARLCNPEAMNPAAADDDDAPSSDGATGAADAADSSPTPKRVRPLVDLERDAILHALRACRGNRTASARALGISVRKLQYRLKEYAEQGISIG
jgi:hypothetical protein